MTTKLKQTSFLFNIIAFLILIGAITTYGIFIQTKQNVKTISIESQISYIDNITDSIASLVMDSTKQKIHYSLKKDEALRKRLENALSLFISDRYKYIYVLDKENPKMKEFRFLLDGTKNANEKSEFEEPYMPYEVKLFNSVYKTKKAMQFQHDELTGVWITYLKPIVIRNKVEAIIVIDFSLRTSKVMLSELRQLNLSIIIITVFSIMVFVLILRLSYMDYQREKTKTVLFNQLKETNKDLQVKSQELELKSQEISKFNKTLTQKVKNEVAKNREKDKQLIQQSRLAQMGEMIGMIAHQWRQPLAAISSCSAAINLKATLGKLDQNKAIELSMKISEYSQHLSTTIDDFREFFKPNKEKRETSFSELINGVLTIVGLTLETKNIKITQNIKCNDTFNSYPNEIKQVILNLIKNAEDVLFEKQIENPYIKIKTYKQKYSLVLEVSDNGGGVPEKILDKIFDPYFSTKKEKDGTGLGLYMSKTIIETHCNGFLSVRNDDRGALFKIEFANKDEKNEYISQ